MTPIRAWMLVIDGEPSFEDIFPSHADAECVRKQLAPWYQSVVVVPVEIREVGDEH